MIIRENARLLFLSALSSNNAKCEDILRPSDFDFRLARKSDIDRIRHCNINTLPENYSEDFYETHMKDWPELALVAEHADRRNEDQKPQVVGYVLGRMEGSKENASVIGNSNTAVQGWSCRGTGRGRAVLPPPTGHVTSLAVLPGFRRCGTARQLMIMLHERMNYYYRADKVSLHVRKSNQGAIRLYEEFLGYKVAGVASSYYSDGEDAFVMEARLPEVNTKPADVISGASPPTRSPAVGNHAEPSLVPAAAAAAAAANSSKTSISGSRNKAGLVTAAAAAAAAPGGGTASNSDHRSTYSRNNVGFVTAAAAAAAAVAAAATTASTAPPTASTAPPLVLRAVDSAPGSNSGGRGGSLGGEVGLGRPGAHGVPAGFGGSPRGISMDSARGAAGCGSSSGGIQSGFGDGSTGGTIA